MVENANLWSFHSTFCRGQTFFAILDTKTKAKRFDAVAYFKQLTEQSRQIQETSGLVKLDVKGLGAPVPEQEQLRTCRVSSVMRF